MNKLPKWFQKLYWWGDALQLNLAKHQRTIITQTINFGRWEHWQWLVKTYGKTGLTSAVQEIPASEFRPSALQLLFLLLGIKKVKYASRSDYIRAKKSGRKDSRSA